MPRRPIAESIKTEPVARLLGEIRPLIALFDRSSKRQSCLGLLYTVSVLGNTMVQLKAHRSTIAQPKPRYGHLSKIDPVFASLKEVLDKRFSQLWSLPLEELKIAYRNAPVALPEDVPVAGEDYQVSDREISTRDGANIGLRIYGPMQTKTGAVLVLKAHGGGK